MKVIINDCYGGFGLSYEAVVAYCKRKETPLYFYEYQMDTETSFYTRLDTKKVQKGSWCPLYLTKDIGAKVKGDDFNALAKDCYFSEYDIERNDPDLVYVVETLGKRANGRYSELKIVETPDDVDFEVTEYDGHEWVAEKHRTWR